jgi:hypothetical protein
LLSGLPPTAAEQLFLERLNDARANPSAYGAAIGVDLSTVASAAPLAFDTRLVAAAHGHAVDMNARGYFGHTTPEGVDPAARLTQAGYIWQSWSESLADGQDISDPESALARFIVDQGVSDLNHRKHLLGMEPFFQPQKQVGIGVVEFGTGPFVNYYDIDTATTQDTRPILTGVVFQDVNGSGHYDVGEGVGNATITVSGAGSTTTFGSGGWSLAVVPGTYTITASGGGLAAAMTRTVTVGTANVRVNFAPQDDAFIAKLYRDDLGRAPAAAETASWVNVLQSYNGPQNVVAGIGNSWEARTHEVNGWYSSFLGRSPVRGEEQTWVQLLVAGHAESEIIAGMVSSPEFAHHAALAHPTLDANRAVVASLYQGLLGRTASAAEMDLWTSDAWAASGTFGVAGQILASPEAYAHTIVSTYATLLHRSPAIPEVSAWAASTFSPSDLRFTFELTPEFFQHG